MKRQAHEHHDPLQVLGISDKAKPEAIFAAYAELSAACRHDPEQLSLLSWAYDLMLQRGVSSSVATDDLQDLSPKDDRDGVVTAQLMPGFEKESPEAQDYRQNIIKLPTRTGATAVGHDAATALENSRESSLQSNWGTHEASILPELATDSHPNEQSGPEGRTSDFERLLGMSQFEESPSLPSNDDEDVLEHLIMRDASVPPLKPRFRRSLIGEGEKEIVSTRAAGTRDPHVMQRVESLMQTATEVSGQLLKEIRELHNVELSEVSARTKVHIRHLLALEGDQLTQLPATVYFRGFVNSYLQYFGINSPALVNQFIQRYLQARSGSHRH